MGWSFVVKGAFYLILLGILLPGSLFAQEVGDVGRKGGTLYGDASLRTASGSIDLLSDELEILEIIEGDFFDVYKVEVQDGRFGYVSSFNFDVLRSAQAVTDVLRSVQAVTPDFFGFCRDEACREWTEECVLAESAPGVSYWGIPGAPNGVYYRMTVPVGSPLDQDPILHRLLGEGYSHVRSACRDADVVRRNTEVYIDLGMPIDAGEPFVRAALRNNRDYENGYLWARCSSRSIQQTSCRTSANPFKSHLAKVEEVADRAQREADRKAREEAEARQRQIAEQNARNASFERFGELFGQGAVFVTGRNIHDNPYRFTQHDRVVLRGRFLTMLSADRAHFTMNRGNVVLGDVPSTLFAGNERVLVAFSVSGNAMEMLPDGRQALTLQGSFKVGTVCSDASCSELLAWTDR